jgi:hypothetical protein
MSNRQLPKIVAFSPAETADSENNIANSCHPYRFSAKSIQTHATQFLQRKQLTLQDFPSFESKPLNHTDYHVAAFGF